MPTLCACGCGARIPAVNKRGESARFKHGHNARLRPRKAERYTIEDRGYDTPCWVWQNAVQSQGYGQVGTGGLAHRVYYERVKGPIPDGMQIDHLCRVPRCVNPDHLEPVTHAENIRRGIRGKLRREQVEALHLDYLESGLSVRAFSADRAPAIGVSEFTIRGALVGATWRDVYDEVRAA